MKILLSFFLFFISLFAENIYLYDKTIGKIEVPCEMNKGKNLVLFAFGQSNAGNHGETKYKTHSNHVFTYFYNKCYKTSDPILGSTGFKGSIWGRLGDLIIENTDFDNVYIINMGISSSSILEWSNGSVGDYLTQYLSYLKNKGITIDFFLWQQGETDRNENLSNIEYIKHFDILQNNINEYFPTAQFIIAQSTFCFKQTYDNTDLGKVFEYISNNNSNVFLGPNTDLLNSKSDRYSSCHFSEKGLEKSSKMWFESIIKYLK